MEVATLHVLLQQLVVMVHAYQFLKTNTIAEVASLHVHLECFAALIAVAA